MKNSTTGIMVLPCGFYHRFKKSQRIKVSNLLRSFLMIALVFLSLKSNAQGTWSPVANTAPNNSGGLMLLLSDGTVMAKSDAGGGSGVVWMKLKPNAQGSYINGSWSSLASMNQDRLYFSSQVLKDGRVYVAGGEYGAGGSSGEVYNPLNNTWTKIPDAGHRISDANSEILSDGRVLQALVESDLRPTMIYDPATNQYSTGPSTNGIHNESAWVKLPDNSILYVDRLTRNSERYIPSQNRWITDATVPVDLYDPFGDETGGSLLLPDGRAFFIGSSGMTAYYTPSGNTNPGSWSAGPNTPNGYGCPDGVASVMPNGKVILVLSPPPTSANHFPGPTFFYEFDYRTNSFTNINAPDGSASGNYSTFVTTMLNLPNGSVMYSVQGNSRYYIYTPSGAQIANGRPVIGNITANNCNGSSYTISGTGFNGISEGTSYGDDWQMATNYPIIRLTNGSNVYYARTYNWNITGVQTGSTATNAQFTLPLGLPNATYSLVVTANGISSDAVSFTPSTCSNQAPTVSITSPANNATFTAPASVTINATAADADGTVSKVDFYSGTTFLGSDNTAPYSFLWTNVGAGSYALTAKATDNLGLGTTSSVINIQVNAVQTGVGTFYQHCNYDPTGYGIALPLGTYTSAQLIAKGILNNDISSVKVQSGYQVTLYADDNFLGTTVVLTADNSCLVANSFNDVTSSIKITTVTSNTPPTVSITSPANNAMFTAPATVTINATAADVDGTVSKVDFYNGTALLNSDNTAPYSFSWTSVAAGTYALTAKATDNSGAITTSAVVTITVSNVTVNTPPTVSITSPANNATFTAPASVTINATATDADGTVSIVNFYNGSTLLGSDNSSPYSFSWTNVAAGTYTLTARATDNGTATTTSAAVTITVKAQTTGCGNIPQYVENNGYVPGSTVQNVGNIYVCRPWPNSGWCNGASWAYGPGIGSAWQDAWTLQGACGARTASASSTMTLSNHPNPTSGITELDFTTSNAGEVQIKIYDAMGKIVQTPLDTYMGQGDHTVTVDVSSLTVGLYYCYVVGNGETKSIVIQKQ